MFRKTAISVVAVAISGLLLAVGGQAVADSSGSSAGSAAAETPRPRPTADPAEPRPSTRPAEPRPTADETRAERARQEQLREAPAARPVRGDARFTG